MNHFAKNGKLSFGTKLGYGLGDLGTNIVLNTTTIYLLYYYTDVFGISTAFAGTIFLVAKLWNALIDPFVGHLNDHTQSRWGKKRPYILFGAVPLAITFCLLFASPELAGVGRSVYGMVTFLLFCTMVALVNVPYASLTATMTRDPDERSELSAYRMTFAIVGTLVAAVSVNPIVKMFPDPKTGYLAVGIIFGLIVTALMLVTFFTSFENPEDRSGPRPNFRQNLAAMRVNGPFLLLAIALVMCTVSNYLIASTMNYYFKYVLKEEKLLQYGFLALFVSAIVVVPLWLALARKFSKRTAFIGGMALLVVVLVTLYLLKNPSPLVVILLLVGAGVGVATVYLFPWAMVPDTVEYSQWKSGVRQEGFLYGFFLFGLKLSQALSGFIAGFALDFFGYVPNAVQSQSTLDGITFIMTIVPCGFLIVGLICLFYYPITPARHKNMVAEIAARVAESPS